MVTTDLAAKSIYAEKNRSFNITYCKIATRLYSFIKIHVSNGTMHNTRIQVQSKNQYSNKTTLISIVEQHAGYKVALVRGGCSST